MVDHLFSFEDFGKIVKRMGSDYIKPNLIADVTLYPTNQGGLKGPIGPDWFGCPCFLHKDCSDAFAWDCRLLLQGRSMLPGENRRLEISFLSGERATQVVRAAGKFYLWSLRIIGEGIVVSNRLTTVKRGF